MNATTFRVNGPYCSPNNLAFLVSRALPILLALAMLGIRHASSGEGLFRLRAAWRDSLRWLCLVAMVPLIWALYWTGSRGAEVAMPVVLCVFLVFEVRRWVALLAVAGAGALGIALFWPRILGFLGEAGHGLLSERLLLWKAALLIIRDHPSLWEKERANGGKEHRCASGGARGSGGFTTRLASRFQVEGGLPLYQSRN